LCSEWRLYYISAPSEFGKTTIASVIYPLYRVFYYNEPYIVISSRVDDTAVELLDEIKNEISDNDKLISVYGDYRTTGLSWSDHFIELKNGSKIRALGWGGNVRGRKRGGYRITLFIGDDPEEVSDLNSESTLKAHRTWLKRSVVPRTDKEYGKVRVVGTRIGFGCTIDNLMNDPRWKGKVYKALVPDDKPIDQRVSIFEDKFSTKFLQNERLSYMKSGELEDWMFERMNEPVSSLNKNLKGVKYWRGEIERVNDQSLLHVEGILEPIPVYTYCAIDPAFGKADNSDPRAILSFAMGQIPVEVVGGELWMMNAMWALEYDYNRMDPDQIIDRFLDLHKKYIYRTMVIETVGGQKIYEFISQRSMQRDMFLVNHPVNVEFVDYHPQSKEDRVYQYFKSMLQLGQVHIRPEHYELEAEFNLFMQNPQGIHLVDAWEMAGRVAVPSVERRNVMSKKQMARRYEMEPSSNNNYLLW
jgi:hypothetical protein